MHEHAKPDRPGALHKPGGSQPAGLQAAAASCRRQRRAERVGDVAPAGSRPRSGSDRRRTRPPRTAAAGSARGPAPSAPARRRPAPAPRPSAQRHRSRGRAAALPAITPRRRRGTPARSLAASAPCVLCASASRRYPSISASEYGCFARSRPAAPAPAAGSARARGRAPAGSSATSAGSPATPRAVLDHEPLDRACKHQRPARAPAPPAPRTRPACRLRTTAPSPAPGVPGAARATTSRANAGRRGRHGNGRVAPDRHSRPPGGLAQRRFHATRSGHATISSGISTVGTGRKTTRHD